MKSSYRVTVLQGGTSCFSGNQNVVTRKGNVPISQIKVGDEVLSYNESSGKDEWKTVKDVFQYTNTKPTVKVKLKNGETIICTADHRFFYNERWVEIKDLLSLKNETNSKL